MLSGISYLSLAETCLGRSFPEEVRNVGHITRGLQLEGKIQERYGIAKDPSNA